MFYYSESSLVDKKKFRNFYSLTYQMFLKRTQITKLGRSQVEMKLAIRLHSAKMISNLHNLVIHPHMKFFMH